MLSFVWPVAPPLEVSKQPPLKAFGLVSAVSFYLVG